MEDTIDRQAENFKKKLKKTAEDESSETIKNHATRILKALETIGKDIVAGKAGMKEG